MTTDQRSLFDDARWTTGPVFKDTLRRHPGAPNAAALLAFIDRTARRGDDNAALYMAARKIEQLETLANRYHDALVTICDIGETRDVEVAEKALRV